MKLFKSVVFCLCSSLCCLASESKPLNIEGVPSSIWSKFQEAFYPKNSNFHTRDAVNIQFLLRESLRSEGYDQPTFFLKQDDQQATLMVSLGEPTRIVEIDLKVVDQSSPAFLNNFYIKNLLPYLKQRLRHPDYEQSKAEVLAYLHRQGYRQAQWHSTRLQIHLPLGEARWLWAVQLGPRSFVESVRYIDPPLPISWMREVTSLKQGDPCTDASAATLYDELMATGWFENVLIRPLPDAQHPDRCHFNCFCLGHRKFKVNFAPFARYKEWRDWGTGLKVHLTSPAFNFIGWGNRIRASFEGEWDFVPQYPVSFQQFFKSNRFQRLRAKKWFVEYNVPRLLGEESRVETTLLAYGEVGNRLLCVFREGHSRLPVHETLRGIRLSFSNAHQIKSQANQQISRLEWMVEIPHQSSADAEARRSLAKTQSKAWYALVSLRSGWIGPKNQRLEGIFWTGGALYDQENGGWRDLTSPFLKLRLSGEMQRLSLWFNKLGIGLRGRWEHCWTSEMGLKVLPSRYRCSAGGEESVRGYPEHALAPQSPDNPERYGSDSALIGGCTMDYVWSSALQTFIFLDGVTFDGWQSCLSKNFDRKACSWGLGLIFRNELFEVKFYGFYATPSLSESNGWRSKIPGFQIVLGA